MPLSGKAILLVEDEVFIAMDIQATLEDAGLGPVFVAGDLEEAKQKFATHRDTIGTIVTDLEFPGGGGVALIKHILALEPDMSFVIITGSPEEKRKILIGDLPITNIPLIDKPLEPSVLVNSVAAQLESPFRADTTRPITASAPANIGHLRVV